MSSSFIQPYHIKRIVLDIIHHSFSLEMSIEKIYAISDLHVDQVENMKWVEQLSNDKYLNDTVIIAGWLTLENCFITK
jgi:hypothetical protein